MVVSLAGSRGHFGGRGRRTAQSLADHAAVDSAVRFAGLAQLHRVLSEVELIFCCPRGLHKVGRLDVVLDAIVVHAVGAETQHPLQRRLNGSGSL